MLGQVVWQITASSVKLTFDSFLGCLEAQADLLVVPLAILAWDLALVGLFAAETAEQGVLSGDLHSAHELVHLLKRRSVRAML